MIRLIAIKACNEQHARHKSETMRSCSGKKIVSVEGWQWYISQEKGGGEEGVHIITLPHPLFSALHPKSRSDVTWTEDVILHSHVQSSRPMVSDLLEPGTHLSLWDVKYIVTLRFGEKIGSFLAFVKDSISCLNIRAVVRVIIFQITLVRVGLTKLSRLPSCAAQFRTFIEQFAKWR